MPENTQASNERPAHIRVVGGTITDIVEGDYTINSETNIINNASTTVIQEGQENGVSYGEYNKPPTNSDKKIILTAYFAESIEENSYQRINNGIIGKEYYLLVKGKNVEGKKVCINIFDKEDTLATVDLETEIGGKTKAVSVLQDEAEVTKVEGIFSDKNNAGEDLAIIPIKIRPKDDDELLELKTLLGNSESKKAFLYLLIEIHTCNDDIDIDDCLYFGKNSANTQGNENTENKHNYWLDIENSYFKVYPCYCNKDFNASELKEMIYHLRDATFFKTFRERFFDLGEDFFLDVRTSDLANNGNNLIPFNNMMNRKFTEYNINTCQRKIHFISQMYVETMNFRSTHESMGRCTGYSGGCDFRGRGMKQITHDYNYLAYYDYVNGTNYRESYDTIRGDSTGVSLESIITQAAEEEQSVRERINNSNLSEEQIRRSNEKLSHIENLMTENLLQTLIDFTPLLSTDLHHAFNSACWFSVVYTSGVLTAMDQGLTNANIASVTRLINGGTNNLIDRQAIASHLQNFFIFPECTNS